MRQEWIYIHYQEKDVTFHHHVGQHREISLHRDAPKKMISRPPQNRILKIAPSPMKVGLDNKCASSLRFVFLNKEIRLLIITPLGVSINKIAWGYI